MSRRTSGDRPLNHGIHFHQQINYWKKMLYALFPMISVQKVRIAIHLRIFWEMEFAKRNVAEMWISHPRLASHKASCMKCQKNQKNFLSSDSNARQFAVSTRRTVHAKHSTLAPSVNHQTQGNTTLCDSKMTTQERGPAQPT